jgi:hypothetical protein
MEDSGRYNHIEDVLVNLHNGQWFGWSDSKNKVYTNLVIHDDTKTKPTEKELTDALTKQQSDFDTQAYSKNRKADYPDWGTQLNKIYDDGVTKWKSEMVDPVKAKWPKDNSGPVE